MGPSIEDEQAIKMIENSIAIKDDQFCVGIPWKQNPINLPSNRERFLKRLNGLKKRFQNDNGLLEAYSNEMQKMIVNGFIEQP